MGSSSEDNGTSGSDLIQMEAVRYLNCIRLYVNSTVADLQLEAWQLILLTYGLTVLLHKAWAIYSYGDVFLRAKSYTIKWFRNLPFVKPYVQKEVDKAAAGMEADFLKDILPGMQFRRSLPWGGMSEGDVVDEAKLYQSMCKGNWKKGFSSGTVYNGSDDLSDFNAKIYSMFTWTNPLHADVFPDIRKMEAEVVRMCCSMFHGGPKTCGTMTSGGTESIMLACKAYRDYARERGISSPEMLIPKSAHAAFEKAAQAFDMRLKYVPLDSKSMTVDVKKMRSMITRSTCMLAVSTPDFAIGVMDPVEEVAKLGQKYGIPVHVDACLGGFLIAFMEKAGFSLPPFDFRVPGVTSISCDTHKYAFAPKGSSVILYSESKYRDCQYFVVTDWPGGIYATPTLGGSRAGALVASCWATLLKFGEEGYVNSTREIIRTTRYIERGLRGIPGIFVYGEPKVSVVAIGSLDFDIYRLMGLLHEQGWSLSALQFPSSLHLCVTLLHTKPGVADRFLDHVRTAAAALMAAPREKPTGMAAIYGMSQALPDRSLVSEMTKKYLDACYKTDYVVPHTAKQNGHSS